MRKRPVGTLSLGALLIILGVAILIAQLKQYPLLNALLTWWPVALILIGGEILWQLSRGRDETTAIKYDGFSMVMIMVILVFAIGMYTLTSINITGMISRLVSSQYLTVEIPADKIEIGDDVEEIILQAPADSLTVDTSPAAGAQLFGTALVNALDQQEAALLVKQCQLSSRQEGNKLYLSIIPLPRASDLKPGVTSAQYNLLLPAGKRVHIYSNDYCNLHLEPEGAANIALVEGHGHVNIKVNKNADLVVEARVHETGQLLGNVNWNVRADAYKNYQHQPQVNGLLQWGNGSHKLTILGAHIVQVNEI